MNNQEKRIKLAEAMGWTNAGTINGVPVGYERESDDCITDLPDPFTSADDDYAILEFMRPDDWINSVPIKGPKHEAWRNFIFELRVLQGGDGRETSAIGEGYKKGDYAEACLKVLP
jgi:hypothetical protein